MDYVISAMDASHRPEIFKTWVTGSTFKTYASDPYKVGFLRPKVAKEVARFYMLAFSVFSRLDELAKPEVKPEKVTLLDSQMHHRALRTSAREMMDQADKVLAMLG